METLSRVVSQEIFVRCRFGNDFHLVFCLDRVAGGVCGANNSEEWAAGSLWPNWDPSEREGAHGRLHAKARPAADLVIYERTVIDPATLQRGCQGLIWSVLAVVASMLKNGRHRVAECGQGLDAQILLLQRPAADFDKDGAESDLWQ